MAIANIGDTLTTTEKDSNGYVVVCPTVDKKSVKFINSSILYKTGVLHEFPITMEEKLLKDVISESYLEKMPEDIGDLNILHIQGCQVFLYLNYAQGYLDLIEEILGYTYKIQKCTIPKGSEIYIAPDVIVTSKLIIDDICV